MLPELGTPSLWDVDEGVNAECARAMREVGSPLIPIFNGELRTAKPALLYWLQWISYDIFGVNEFAARFPSVLCSIGSVLTIAALARRMYGPTVGLMAGLILATTIEFVKLAHAATPDAPLIFFVCLTFYLTWIGHQNGSRTWLLTAPIPAGLAVLTKGPAYLGLMGLPIVLYFLWCGEWRRLLDRRLFTGFLIFFAVAGPWYIAVTAETRGVWLKTFIGIDNVARFREPLEGHDGKPLYQAYYLACIAAFSMPWSVFLVGTFRGVILRMMGVNPRTEKFLLCWFGVILVVTSIMSTKLPNYIATLYPPLAILTARFLVGWRDGETVPRWLMPTAAWLVTAIGVGILIALLIVGGVIPVAGVRTYPALAPYAGFGLILAAGGLGMAYFLHNGDRSGVLASLVASVILFVGLTASFAVVAFDRYKAPRDLVRDSGAFDPNQDIRLASLDYTQPSVTFYAQRDVERLTSPQAAADYLMTNRPGFLFLTAETWPKVAPLIDRPVHIVARRFDLYRHQDVLVISNRK